MPRNLTPNPRQKRGEDEQKYSLASSKQSLRHSQEQSGRPSNYKVDIKLKDRHNSMPDDPAIEKKALAAKMKQ